MKRLNGYLFYECVQEIDEEKEIRFHNREDNAFYIMCENATLYNVDPNTKPVEFSFTFGHAEPMYIIPQTI